MANTSVTLSQRNILTLLSQLVEGREVATVYKPTEQGLVEIKAIPDTVAYANRKPGIMRPSTERFIERLSRILAMWKVIDASCAGATKCSTCNKCQGDQP
jgi:hypothetical protein